MKKHIVVENLEQIPLVATQLIQLIGTRKVVCFDAPMGSGKTTLINAMLKELDCEDAGSSPTYAVINEHFSPKKGTIYHLDLYRLNSANEAFDIGIEDVLYGNHLCFIEWPDKIRNLLPDSFVWINIVVNKMQHRIISFEL